MSLENCEVELSDGKIRGLCKKNYLGQKYFAFHAIPYAQPPIGQLRFKDPVPVAKWTGVLDATADNAGCYAKHMIFQTTAGSEDCLYLNVYAKHINNETEGRVPVMFWIHGGGFTSGSNSTEFYDPEFLLIEDVVLVTINYRLGALGLIGKGAGAEGGSVLKLIWRSEKKGYLSLENTEVSGNAAFKDMVMALHWVQKNIGVFGGDSNNVTVFGESAGAAATHLLILSPMAKGLFHKAIMQSGCALNVWAQGSPRLARKLLQHLNFKGDEGNDAEILEFLQSITVEELFKAQEKIKDKIVASKQRYFGYVIEKKTAANPFLTEHPLDVIRAGRYNHVPIVIGFNDSEGMLFELMAKKSGNLKFISDYEQCVPYFFSGGCDAVGSELSRKLAAEIQRFYYGTEEASFDNIRNYYNLQSDLYFVHGIDQSVREHLETSKSPIFYYRFTIDSELNTFKKFGGITSPGVCHGDELNYLFKNDFIKTLEPQSLEENSVLEMVTMWTNFARNNDPNPIRNRTQSKWLRCQKPDATLYFDIGRYAMAARDSFDEKSRMQFWDRIFHDYYPKVNKSCL